MVFLCVCVSMLYNGETILIGEMKKSKKICSMTIRDIWNEWQRLRAVANKGAKEKAKI